MSEGDRPDLPLFEGTHVPSVRFRNALDRLDLAAAVADAPEPWRDSVAEIAQALGGGSPADVDLAMLVRSRREDWPQELERTWQRLVGLHLDRHGIPGVLGDELAGSFLLRGGERERARRSIGRHLDYHPADPRGWRLLAEFEPLRGAARCAFHGGPVLEDQVVSLLDLIQEDEIDPPALWLLSYAFFVRAVDLDEVAAALRAEGILHAPPMTLPKDGRSFAWYLLDAGGRPLGPGSDGVVAARERLQRISPAAFRRYLARVARR